MCLRVSIHIDLYIYRKRKDGVMNIAGRQLHAEARLLRMYFIGKELLTVEVV